ncbi:MAG: hypothetical protein KIT84_30090 [Labilithrix sp.]|nr:hypothetical protein [Labilithrix sp.]MCW5815315.1 hypothetical protein [Labilithrix sp.]
MPAFVMLPFLVASSVGRRFGSTPQHVVVTEDRALDVGGKLIARDDVRDVWLDDDPLEPRVVIGLCDLRERVPRESRGHGGDLALLALWFENREQAKRFARALGGHEVVAGNRPRKGDLLAPFRFVAVTLVLLAAHAWYGAFVLVFFAIELRTFLLARQLVVRGSSFELRSAFDSESFAIESVQAVDVDEGVITLRGDRELRFATPNARDLHFAAPPWSDRLRRRALTALAARKKEAGSKAAGPSEESSSSKSP